METTGIIKERPATLTTNSKVKTKVDSEPQATTEYITASFGFATTEIFNIVTYISTLLVLQV